MHDQSENILEIDIRYLPLRSFRLLNLCGGGELRDITILRRKRCININSLGYIFSEISRCVDIRFEGLIRQCKRANPVSRPTFQLIVEKLAEIGTKYEKRSQGKEKGKRLNILSTLKGLNGPSCCATKNWRRNVYS